jgi:flagellar basal body-associated protein FliL
MSALSIVLLILVIQLAIIGGLVYFFWVKWGKSVFKMIKTLYQVQDFSKKTQNLPKLSHFQEELAKIQKILEKNHKK